ncbi:ras-related and estrogen-regulated growth inhibitor-like protein [Amphiprion ocellaris]|uniref:small monomeric GTPase n=1 Tax=Amphiprion ocellaris TaxID=80972 RepID=A0AAQ5ZCL1_AMPOC|nr:ras-related and estrogen-regulated growth inhibitor-like protein [Amphiprion ocellaris]XP_054869837.1 ras-related and estrogen-regulated growth inhibitor-like protein [Amphiprion ocellaris]
MGVQEVTEGSQPRVEVNILLLGAHNVGKSALTVRFLTRRFIGEYGDIESVYSRVDTIDGQEICFNIWDSQFTQVGEKSCGVSDKQLQWADGMILVYDICDRSSFDVALQQLQEIRRRRKPSSVPVVIVANKRDLRRHRSVSGEEGRLLALSQRCGFFEVSAAETYHGVLLVFHRLVDLVRERRALRKSSAGVRGIVRSVSAVFGKKRAE